MAFFEAAANWAQRRDVTVQFERDAYDGWYARVPLKDARGSFLALVGDMERHPKTKGKPAETVDEFEDRVAKQMANAVVAARKRRAGIGLPSLEDMLLEAAE